jgi:hypothetical protein
MDSPAKQEVASPAMPKGEPRTKKALLAFSDEEWALVEQAAGGFPPATWMRVIVVEAARKALKEIKP